MSSISLAPPAASAAPAEPLTARDLKRYAGLVTCNGCSTVLALLPKKDVEIAWAEETICSVKRRAEVTIYYCRACSWPRLNDGRPAPPLPSTDGPEDVSLSR